jgi:hypothetical protein
MALAPMLRTLMMRPQRRSFIWGATSRINRTSQRAAWQQGRKELFYPYGKPYAQTIGEQD